MVRKLLLERAWQLRLFTNPTVRWANSMRPLCILFVCVLILCISPLSASEVDNNHQSIPSPIIDSLKRIVKLRQEILEVEQEAGASEGDAYQTLRLQSLEKNKQLVAELQELHFLTHDFITQGGDMRALLKPYESTILRGGSNLRSDISYYSVQVKKNASANTLTPEGLKEHQLSVSRLVASIVVLDEYIGLVLAMGIDASPSETFIKETLPAHLEYLAGHIRLSIEREHEIADQLAIDKANIELKNAERLVQSKLSFDTQRLHQLMTIAENYDVKTESFHSLLIKGSNEVSTRILDVSVMRSFLRDWWLDTKYDLRVNAANYLLQTILFCFILFLFYGLARLINHLILRSVNSGRLKITQLLQDMLLTLTMRLMLFFGLLVGLSQLGVSLGPVLAGLGIAGFIIGFALQNTLGNFASGLMILFCRPYDVGDVVEGGGVFGKVKSMNIVSTTILTFDNQTLILPNSRIWGDVIKNVTAQRVRRIDMVFSVSYRDDIEKVNALLHEIVEGHEQVLKEPETMIRLHTLGNTSVDFIVRPWVRTADYWDVYWDITWQVKVRFEQAGITIPFPQQDVHIYHREVANSDTP